jgi:hypothetical protein
MKKRKSTKNILKHYFLGGGGEDVNYLHFFTFCMGLGTHPMQKVKGECNPGKI